MEIFDLIYYATLFLIPVAPYFLLFKHSSNNRFYTNRDWFYVLKLILAFFAVKKYQKKCKRTLDENTIKNLENPKKISSDNYTDNHFIYGVDQKGNNLSLRFTIQSNQVAEVFLCLRLENGAVYTFPGKGNNNPTTNFKFLPTGDQVSKLYCLTNWHWKTKDLHIDILEPFTRLRVSFNGLLSNANHDVEHVQFNFIWASAGSPNFFPQDAPTRLLADALARHQWREGDWISLLGDEIGYEQFGALRGYVKGDAFEDDLLLNLPSCRTRFWCTDEKLALDRSIRLFVAGKDGTLVNLWIKAFRKGCKEIQYGSVITCGGKVLSVTDSDVRIECLGQNKEIPSAFTAHIKAQGKEYKTVFHLNKNKCITTVVNKDHERPELLNIPTDCDQNVQQAKSLVEFWYHGTSKSRDTLPSPLLLENTTKHLPKVYVADFSDKNAKMVRLTGGKGCSLAMLASIKSDKFIVPDGFVVTVNAFNKQIEENSNIKKTIASLEDICCGRVKGDLDKACSQTVKTFQTEEILPEIKQSIIDSLRNIKKDPTITINRWAVRSSAIGEDSEELSAAGQNESFLGCIDEEAVIKSVFACWASLFTYQSVKYRHQHGLPIASQMAVVVQKMIPADSAGVLFTCHPSTGNPAHMVITSNHGLGESVVSGRSDPDTIILERTFDNNLTIKSRALGSKLKMIKLGKNGVEEVEGIAEFSITDTQALDLGRVGVLLEEKFGSARDIEWGFCQGRLFLLQARPITTLTTWSNYELSHEFDVPSLSEDSIYTIANTGEVLPGALSTLALTTIVRGLDAAICRNIEGKEDPYAFKCLSIFQHHLLIDVANGIHRQVEKTITLNNKILDLAIFGHPIMNEKIHSLALTRFGAVTPRVQLKEFINMIIFAWKNEKHAELCKRLSRTTEVGVDEKRDTSKDIYVKISKSLETFTECARLHSLTTRTSISYQFLSMMFLAEGNKDLTVEHYNDIAMLLASCDDVISAEIPNTLANISNILAKNNQGSEFALVEADEGRKWLHDNVPEAAQMFEKFLKDHGHRGVAEFDINNKTWETKPSEVIRMIQVNCKTNATKQQKVSTSIEEVIDKLQSPKKSFTRKMLKFLMRKGRKAVGIREHTKSETIRYVNKLRIAYRFLGEKMAHAGLIPDPELIFHLSHNELEQVIDGCERSPALVTKATKRQKLHSKWDELKFPEISYGIPQNENRTFIPRVGSGKVTCVGTPVCTGIIQARACVLTDLKDIGQLQEGDVLITYCTDIGWSPYFPMLGGIVTELGGLVSHGAVIAREYGLPCIVGAEGATKIFKTGDCVLLSGKNGTIELI